MKHFRAGVVIGLALCSACASMAEEEVDFPDLEEWADGGKEDTGYVGTRAAEMEAILDGRVRVMLPGQSASQLERTATALRANSSAWEHRAITAQITEQIKYARNALKAEALNLNL